MLLKLAVSRRCAARESVQLVDRRIRTDPLAKRGTPGFRAKVPREEQDLGVVDLEEFLTSLKDGDGTLVEIAEYKVFHPFRPRAATWGESRYIAYVLFADGHRIQGSG